VVTNPEVSSVRDADRVIGLAESSEKRRPVNLLINRIDAARVAKKDMLSVEDIVEVLGSKVIGIIPEDQEILTGSNRGTPVVISGQGAAAAAFKDVARRIVGEDVPLVMPKTGGFLQRLFGRG
jgi:septum site-determining protein MinD